VTLEVSLLFLSEYGVFSSKCNFILTLFRWKKLKDVLCLDDVICFGRKREIFFKVQLCTDAFLRRKAVEKPFAAQTPPRKRGYFSTHQTIVGKNFPYLRNFLSSLADAPHCSIKWGLYKVKLFSTKVLFFTYSNSQQDLPLRQARCLEMTLLNYSFLFGWCKVKFFLYFIVANGFHFPKQSFAPGFHSLLTHLFRFESAA